ncbi:signal protein [Sphingomonas sp. Leaf357]|uniref:sensor histidine kinase n=1 Tax=Sphingomonas sp. Leaf357 TaxID=1736350 RepID=UPI0006FE7239|nr:HAMP domain-containing sensor histidine kinase [Sphingomonas sp. Leaf357]KQS01877.1 signal protein [Sphingomonas sp. Leaf357]
MLRLSVTARIALLAIALALVTNLVLATFLWQQIHGDAVDAVRRDTNEQSDAFVSVYRSGGVPALVQAIRDASRSRDSSLIALIVDESGRRVSGIGPDQLPTPVTPSGTFHVGSLGDAEPWAGREAGYIVRRIGAYRLISGHLMDDWQQEQRGIERALLLATILSLMLGVVGGLVVARYVGRRLNNIAAVIEGVGQGDLSRRVGSVAGGGDAFDRLSIRLDAMLDKVERLMGELRIVTDSLAHDLRSPIARLRAKTETAILVTDPVQRDAALSGLLVETDLVMRMLSTLLEITRSQSVSRDRFTDIDPAALVEEIAELYEPVADDAGITFAAIVESHPPHIVMHRELMTQAITNLIDNALRHAGGNGEAGGGDIVLRLKGGGGSIRLQVEDRGPGIAEQDREQALSRFGRLDSARTIPGAGLGLSLVAAVARLHGGRLELGDNAPGLIAAIVLPG